MEKNIYVSHFAVGHKLIKHYKSAIVQLKKKDSNTMNETIGKPWVWTQQNSTLISHDIKKAHNCLLQSELSHKEKQRYCILTHIYGI